MRDEDLQPGARQYAIGSDGRVRVLKAGATVDPRPIVFSSLEQLAQVTESWPMRRMLEIWNQLPGERKVTRFESRRIAVERLWQALEKSHSKKQPAKANKRRRGETASSRIIALLQASDTVSSQRADASHRLAGPQHPGLHQPQAVKADGPGDQFFSARWRASLRIGFPSDRQDAVASVAEEGR